MIEPSPEVAVHEAKCEMIDAAVGFREALEGLSNPRAREIMRAYADELDAAVAETVIDAE